MLRKIILSSFLFMICLYVLNLSLRMLAIFMLGDFSDFSVQEIIRTLYNAFLYDGQIIGVMAMLYFLLGIISIVFSKTRFILNAYVYLSIIVTSFVEVANIGFYQIYGDVFNANLLGIIFDDREAILNTAINGDFGILHKIIIWIFISIIFILIFRFCFKKIRVLYVSKALNFALFIVFGFSCLFAINGHIGLSGISLGQRIIPVSAPLLRKLTMGGFRDLGYVYKGYVRIYHSKFSDYIAESPREVAVNFFGIKDNKGDINLADLLTKKVENPSNTQITHIFYIVAESLSKWHFDKEFDEIGLMSNLKSLIRDDGAFSVNVFLENAASTIKSLDVQLSGLYQIEIPFNLSVKSAFNTSIGHILKDLGYESRFYYGGSGTWQKIDTYTKTQGFDKIFYNSDILKYIKDNEQKNIDEEPPFANSWGVYDNFLYDFIRDNTPEYKTFSMVFSTSNHPPYDVPLQNFDLPLDKISKFVDENPRIKDKKHAKKILSHIAYQDKMIYKFIKETSKKFPNSLFIVTGDHYDREYIFHNVNISISNQIPLILYAPSLKIKKLRDIASHIDIASSIIELVAPNGYKYQSFGSPIFTNINPKQNLKLDSNRNYALGYFAVADNNCVYNGIDIYYLNNKKKCDTSLYIRLKRAKALSYYIFKNGYIIK